jgi:hypothetical protein
MGSPVYIPDDTGGVYPDVLPSTGDSYFISTNGQARTFYGIDGQGVQAGAEVKIINNGPEDVTLVHHDPNVSHPMFLPGDVDRVLGPNGQSYWMVRNEMHPHGDGWVNGEDPA